MTVREANIPERSSALRGKGRRPVCSGRHLGRHLTEWRNAEALARTIQGGALALDGGNDHVQQLPLVNAGGVSTDCRSSPAVEAAGVLDVGVALARGLHGDEVCPAARAGDQPRERVPDDPMGCRGASTFALLKACIHDGPDRQVQESCRPSRRGGSTLLRSSGQ